MSADPRTELIDLLEEERLLREQHGFHPRIPAIYVRTTELTAALAGRTL